ncbi:MAG: killer suppression protein [Candidatus Thiodiazotropha sp. (ex Dulcina madagascariensis)]|nr:killer suppression protein [Candidatus Thiodiazotropha sp. (ex Dulcina madagascariensis)]
MDIVFLDRKLKKEYNDKQSLVRRHGEKRAKLIMRRLTQLHAASCLMVLAPPYSGPARCHELKGNKRGIFSVDLDHPYRLLFRPYHDPVPQQEEEGIDWG